MAGLTPEDSIFGNKTEAEGKSSSEEDVGSSPLCPKCHSKRVWKDAMRQNSFGYVIQRWYCRDCGRRFSDPKDAEKAKREADKLRAKVETVDTKSLKSAEGI